MAIQMITPRDNASIPHLCVAFGTKGESDPRPAGILIGLQYRDGPVDENRVVGGTTVVVKDRHGNEDKSRWVIQFELKHAQKGDYYLLRLLNPIGSGATRPDPDNLFFDSALGCTNLQVVDAAKRVDVSKDETSSRFLNLFGIGYPSSASTPPASSVIALGDLPLGEVDVDSDPTKTYIDCPDCGNTRTGLLFAFPDGFGNYYAFFNDVVAGTGKEIKLHITYVDQGLEDEVAHIFLS